MYNLFWVWWVRVPLFIGLYTAGYGLSAVFLRWSDLPLLLNGFVAIGAGDYEVLGRREFAYALACLIVSSAAGLAFAFLVMHVVLMRLELWRLRRKIDDGEGSNLGSDLDHLRDIVGGSRLVGHAFRQFADTCFKEKGVLYASVRPQMFVNLGMARELLFGLKMTATIPSYFVGFGLLMTFVGLVIALAKAAGGLTGDTALMNAAVNELLDAATFKFSTSIAGLFSSLALSLSFRIYTIWMETGFEKFCRAVERRLLYLPPQTLSVRMQATLDEQVKCLKQITDDSFFTRLGETVGPTLTSAVQTAIVPVGTMIGEAVDKMNRTSHEGLGDLIEKFIGSLQQGAGKEIQEMGSALTEIRGALQGVTTGLSESGTQFSGQMESTITEFKRVFEHSNARAEATNAASHDNMKRLLETMDNTLEQVKASYTEVLENAGKKVDSQLEDGLRNVLGVTAERMADFERMLSGIQTGVAENANAAMKASNDAAGAAADAAARAATEISATLRDTLGATVQGIRTEIDQMCAALKTSESALGNQAAAMQDVATQSQGAAREFSTVATTVKAAAGPLTASNEQIASAAKEMSSSIRTSVESLSMSHEAAGALADRLRTQVEQINQVWESYEKRFKEVDVSMAGAVGLLATENERYQERTVEFVKAIDQGCSKAVTDLGKFVQHLSENTEELGETFENFLTKVKAAEQAYAPA